MLGRDCGEGFYTSLFPESSMELVVFWAESLYLHERVCLRGIL